MLERIIARKREDVARRQETRPQAGFQLQPSDRSLVKALSARHTGFIMECKHASPSGGVLRQDFDPVAIARDYAPMADAISVITDEPYFQGSLDYLRAVRAAVDLPVLCKDFVVDPYQVYEARHYGADALLLMLSVLDDRQFLLCKEAATELAMEVLAEVHDEQELERALRLGSRIIGINNRDLRTLQVDLAVTERLSQRVPADRLIVSESGVRNHGDVMRLRDRADAFLVGTALVSTADTGAAARELVYGRVKVCGLTTPRDAALARQYGASWGGLILAPESPRRVTVEQAEEIRRAAPLRWAGVFVNEEPRQIAAVAARLALDAVQLHGEEGPLQVQELRSLLPESCEIWKAARVRDSLPEQAPAGATRLLLDTYQPGARGGTGTSFDWSMLGHHPLRSQLILSGGLNPENAARAQELGAWALDVNSGVETAPGRKSETRLRDLFAELSGKTRCKLPI